MARNTAPRIKKMRALGTQMPGLSRKSVDKRPYPPGQHGQQRKKMSEFGLRLHEVQKLRFNYGVSEKQLRRVVSEARRRRGDTGHHIAELLERRLDNAVFRAGYAPTIPAARQLIGHGHLKVNGRKVDIASYRVKTGDVLSLHDRSKTNLHIGQSLQVPSLERPSWIDYDANKQEAKIVGSPDLDSVPMSIQMSMIIEFYNTRL